MAGTFLVQFRRLHTKREMIDHRNVALLDKSQASIIWFDKTLFPENYHEAFFELLKKFELVYWMEAVSKFLVPSGLLDEKWSSESQVWSTSTDCAIKIRKLRFSRFFPIGLFHRLIVQLLQYFHSNGDVFINYALWKSGIILSWDNVAIRVEQQSLAIIIQVQSSDCYDIFSVDKKITQLIHLVTKTIETNFPGKL